MLLTLDLIIRRRDGTIPGGPDVTIPPPTSLAVAGDLPTLGENSQ